MKSEVKIVLTGNEVTSAIVRDVKNAGKGSTWEPPSANGLYSRKAARNWQNQAQQKSRCFADKVLKRTAHPFKKLERRTKNGKKRK